ncbi:MAG TPA: hypothetical protein VL172_00565 [Kofleriaceae bacterium]|nr:hypothetical protein [Kofleriaceae bacterium]
MQPRIAAAARILAVAGLALAAAASAKQQTAPPPQGPEGPPAAAMAPEMAIGLWKSNFGPVKIERDPRGSAPEDVNGVWSYMRGDQQVTGVFWGRLRGNVLDFHWDEPAQQPDAPHLLGDGQIQFTPDGSRFDGQWWTTTRDRSGGFNGTRFQAAGAPPAPPPGSPPAPPPVDTYGGAAPPPPAPY